MTGSKVALAAAMGIFLALGGWQSRTFMAWSEETMVYPSIATPVVAAPSNEGDTFRLEPSCTGASEPLIGFSDGRPRMFACAFDRKWPVMIAPYLGGFVYWPLALLAPLHQGNVFRLRWAGLLVGAASILLTFAVVRRLRGPRLAALAALTMAVTPGFVVVHSTLVLFETLPWLLLMVAVLLLLRSPGLFEGPSNPRAETRALVLATFLVGLACITNLKTVLFVVPMIAVAHRLGVRPRPLRLGERLGALVAFGLPCLVLLPVLLAPAGGYADKASSAPRALLRNLLDPARIVPYTRDLLLFWSDIAEFLARPIGASHPNRLATVLAVVALGFTCVATVLALRRKQGCPVTAATGACIVVQLLTVTLLYENYPANFAPLHALFGLAGAVTVDASITRLAVRRASILALLVIVWLAPFAVSVVLVIRAMVDARVPANAGALRSLVEHLEERQGEGALVVNTHVMLTGVVESLSNETVRTLQAQNYLNGCSRGRDPGAREACLERRFSQLLSARSETLRFIVPSDPKTFGGDGIWFGRFLLQAAQARGRRVDLERSFSTPEGTPVIDVYRVEAP